MDRWEELAEMGVEIPAFTQKLEIFRAAVQVLTLLDELLPVAEGEPKGAHATALMLGLSVLFERDHEGDNWGAMLRCMGSVKSRPKSMDELVGLGIGKSEGEVQ